MNGSERTTRMRILLTNDDGIQAVGLRALDKALRNAGHQVTVVAPVTEQSAVGHALTMASPLRVKEFKENGFHGYGVHGTPVDCVKLAVTSLLGETPELVVSGINAGANVGIDLLYSGTVSAATEGAFMGLPSLAVSHDSFLPDDLSEQGAYVARLLERLPLREFPANGVLNLNFPGRPMSETLELRVCPHTRVAYEDSYEQRLDPRGRAYYWLVGSIPPEKVTPGTDRFLLTQGHITLTPLRFDFTDYDMVNRLKELSF